MPRYSNEAEKEPGMIRRLMAMMMLEAEAAQVVTTQIIFVVENGRTQALPPYPVYPSSEVTCNILLTCNGTQNYSQAVSVLLAPAETILIDVGTPVSLDSAYPLILQVSNVKIEGTPAAWDSNITHYTGYAAPISLYTDVSAPAGGSNCTFTVSAANVPNIGGHIAMGITIYPGFI
jgi:hypothetical protein